MCAQAQDSLAFARASCALQRGVLQSRETLPCGTCRFSFSTLPPSKLAVGGQMKNGCNYRHNRFSTLQRRGQDSPLIIRALTPFDYQLVTFLEIAKKRNFRLPSVPILSEYTMLLMR